MYRSEQAFSQAFLRLFDDGRLVQRIESALTGAGIPDIYMRTSTREYWIELKNMRSDTIHDSIWTIPWRPGQQAWSERYRRVSHLYSYTVCALKDGFIIIPMMEHYKHGIVNKSATIVCTTLRSIKDVFI